VTALVYSHVDSPVGPLLVAGDGETLRFLSFPSGHKSFGPAPDWRPDDAPFGTVRRQLGAYFAGELRQFDLPLRPSGTAFQLRHWALLEQIPYGQTRTYGALAQQIGAPRASRAVGAANGNNPLPIILPCHRVLGANGALTGFGGGIAVKRYLLALEAAVLGRGDWPAPLV